MRVGSLFAGIGGFDLAARWMGWETVWYSEVDSYCCDVMARHFPEARSLGDVRAVDGYSLEAVDIMVGGFPCQDISEAGKRVGIGGERSGLWREYARLVRECRPRWVVIENVAALLRRGYDVVRGDLRAAGYRVARPVVMSASQVGAPQERKRLWIVANTDDARLQGAERPWQPDSARSERAASCGQPVRPAGGHWPPGPGAVSDIPRETDGVPHRAHRLRALGNAVVPTCAFVIFKAIQAHEDWRRMIVARQTNSAPIRGAARGIG